MSVFTDLTSPETLASVRARVRGFAESSGVAITDWVVGAVGEQLYQAMCLALYTYAKVVPTYTRGFVSLDLSTDPGDVDPYDDSNELLAPADGYLSAFGANTFGTTRAGATAATGFFTLANTGAVARTFAPDSLTFTWTAVSPPTPAPTYRNSADPTIYTNADGTCTLAAGATIILPITAEEDGTRSNAPATAITLTTTLLGCAGTNALAVTGSDREDADTYRARCRQAPARISLGGPSAAYQYLAAKNLDGTPLLNASGNAVNITRVQTTQDSSTGIVLAKYASDSGAASGEDVTAANTNIEADAFAVPDAITFTGSAAVAVSIHVSGTAKVKAGPGVTEAAVKAAILAALAAAFQDGDQFPVGGLDQDGSGNGVIYTTDLRAIAAGAYPGLYAVATVTPAAATTALAFGEVATLNSVAGDWTVTIT